jgi:subtilisin family serine protease
LRTATILERREIGNGLSVYRLSGVATSDLSSLVASSDGLVEPNYLVALQSHASTIPAPPGQPDAYEVIGVRELQTAGIFGSKQTVVAVIDSGAQHDSLKNNYWESPAGMQTHTRKPCVEKSIGYDAIKDECATILQDSLGHGTDIAGVIGAHGEEFVGVNREVSLLIVKAFHGMEGRVEDVIRGLAFLHHLVTQQKIRIDIVNASWGYDGVADGISCESQFLKQALHNLVAEDVLIVAAADSSERDLDIQGAVPFYLASFWYDQQIRDSLISVSSTNAKDQIGHSWGVESVDMRAPGIGARSVRVDAGSGTSRSAALVAGAAALVRASCKDLSAKEAKDLLFRTADSIDEHKQLTRSRGRLNVSRAVKSCLDSQLTR